MKFAQPDALEKISIQAAVQSLSAAFVQAEQQISEMLTTPPNQELAQFNILPINHIRRKVRDALFTHLNQFIDQLENEWPDDEPELPLNLLTLSHATIDDGERERLNYEIAGAIERFLQQQFAKWVTTVDEVVAAVLVGENILFPLPNLNTFYERLPMGTPLAPNMPPQLLQELAQGIVSGGDRWLTQNLLRLGLAPFATVAGKLVFRRLSRLTLFLTELINLRHQSEVLRQKLKTDLRKQITIILKNSLTVPQLTKTDVMDVEGLKQRLISSSDLFSRSLQGRLVVTDSDSTERLLGRLNQLVYGVQLSDLEGFDQLSLTPPLTDGWQLDSLKQEASDRLNRQLLAEVYPQFIFPKLHDLLFNIVDIHFLNFAVESTGQAKMEQTAENQRLMQIRERLRQQKIALIAWDNTKFTDSVA